MSYKDLPLEQRIELASQYALLLTADDKPTWEIIGILKTDYALTEEQTSSGKPIITNSATAADKLKLTLIWLLAASEKLEL